MNAREKHDLESAQGLLLLSDPQLQTLGLESARGLLTANFDECPIVIPGMMKDNQSRDLIRRHYYLDHCELRSMTQQVTVAPTNRTVYDRTGKGRATCEASSSVAPYDMGEGNNNGR